MESRQPGSDETRPIWSRDGNSLSYPRLEKNTQTDVCVIGAGMAGLNIAYRLQAEGFKVVLIEDGLIGSGESARTTGHLSKMLDEGYSQLIKTHGMARAKLAADSHSQAIDCLESIIQLENIDCDFIRLPGYLFMDPHSDSHILEAELEALIALGFKDVSIDHHPHPGTQNFGSRLKVSNEAQFHIVKYMDQMAQILRNRGVEIYTLTRAAEIDAELDGSVTITTESEHTIKARHCVLAVNAPTFAGNLIDSKMVANRSYAIAADIPKNTLEYALYWDMADPYHYVRLQKGEACDQLIIGGEDHRTGDGTELNQHFEHLESWARAHFPSLATVTHKWSGQILEPNDYMAFIGRRSTHENVYIVSGDSGHGLTHAMIAAMLITDLIQGKANPWQALYDPTRAAITPLTDFIQANLETAGHYLDYLTTGALKDPAQLSNGQAAILQYGLKKVACYRDESGKLHSLSAVCPHKKGLLKWNSVEKSWDCPMHGSRFSAEGCLLNGPANSDLLELEL